MAQNEKTVTGPTKMDSRKFLGALNDSAQAKIAFMESRVAEMGKQVGRRWALAALRAKDLFIEDRDSNQYFVAQHRREKGGRVVIEGIQEVQIVEEQKSKLFTENCLGLVSAIENNDARGMAANFNKMASQRFSSRAIPFSGKVRTRDGQVRYIPTASNSILPESTRTKLIAAVVEGLKDRVVVSEGTVLEASFSDGQPLKLPVNRWASHKLVARRMREAAQNAYWSEGFRRHIYQAAKFISEDKVEEAVKTISGLLKENEEFTLLTRAGIQSLVENTLAGCGVFNQQLCNDAALLLYRTNLKLNRDTILREWRTVARRAQHPTLLENVNILEQAKNFEAAHDRFLTLIFEAISDREVTAEALATTLQVLKDRTPKIKESHELSSKLDDLIGRLKDKEFDDNAIYEAEDFIATVQEELATGDDLQNFDSMPGDSSMAPAEEAGEDLSDALGSEDKQQQPQIVINAPLISFGGDGAPAGGMGGAGEEPLPDDDLSGMMGGAEQEQDQEQDDLLGMGQQAGGQGMGMESRRARPAVREEWDEKKYGKAPWKKGDAAEDDGDSEEDEDDSDDPYKFDESVAVDYRTGIDYGAPAITDPQDLRDVTGAMRQLAVEHKLSGRALAENLEDLALAGMEVVGLRLPQTKLGSAVDQAVRAFSENCGLDANRNGQDDCEEGPCPRCKCVECECDNPAEDQFKWGTTRRKGGLKRSAVNRVERGTKSESIQWIETQADGMLGEMAGVRFIFDHGGDNPAVKPAILSEDGRVQIPVPAELFDSAFAAAGLAEAADPRAFTRWLMEGPLDQVAPETPDEADAMDNELEYDDGSDSFPGGGPADDQDGMGGPVGTMEPMDEPHGPDLTGGAELGDDDPGMDDDLGGDLEGAVARITAKPDGTITVEVGKDAQVADMGGAAEPDDAGVELGAEDPGVGGEMQPVDSVVPDAAEPAAGGLDDEMPDFEADDDAGPDDFAEDEDITSPKSSRYTSEVKGNLREVPDAGLPSKTDDELEGFGKEPKKGDKSGSGVKPARPRSDD